MINKKYLKLLRTKDRKYGENFIYNEISKNIIDSLDILKVRFDNILTYFVIYKVFSIFPIFGS